MPVIYPVQVDLEPQLITVTAGSVKLRHDLQSSISEPFCGLVENVPDWINLLAEKLGYFVEKFGAQSYCKASRQLYSCMTDPEKSLLQPLKSVIHETSYVPIYMANALSIIGNFELKLGPIEVKDLVVRFRLWNVKNLSIDPEIENFDIGDTVSQYVWLNHFSNILIDEVANLKFKEYCNNDTFQVDINTITPTFGVPLIPGTAPGYNAISDLFPNATIIRALVAILVKRTASYIGGDPLCEDANIVDSLHAADLLLAPEKLSDT